MDKPIEIAVMLFVALVVGITLLSFVNSTLDRSERSMHNLFASQSEIDDKIFVSTTLSPAQAEALVVSCYESNRGKTVEETKLCMIYRVDSSMQGTIFPTGNVESSLGDFEVEGTSESCRAFFVIYFAYENKVVVEC